MAEPKPPVKFNAARVNVLRGKSLAIPGEIGEDIRELCLMLDWFEAQLDELDDEDALGTEGWRHYFGIED